jgi:hypothetical protein
MKRGTCLVGFLMLSACFGLQSKATVGQQRYIAAPRSPAFEDGPMVDAAVLRSDFDLWLERVKTTNPDLGGRADLTRLDAKAREIRATLTHSMTRREAWLRFALLNPLFNDGHSGIFLPKYRAALEDHLKQGGSVFPVEVRIDQAGQIIVSASKDRAVRVGSVIRKINGVDARFIVAALIARAPGDNERHRRAWTSRRFAALYWAGYGDSGSYRLQLGAGSRQIIVAGATELPLHLQSNPRPEALYSFKVLKGGIGYLRLDSFDEELAPALEQLSTRAFATFRKAGVRALIIDIRENGGGSDPPWQRSVMNRLTAKPYAQLSRYSIRVTPENADPGDIIGSVQTAEYKGRQIPPPDDLLRFTGPVYLLVGPYTYSSAIQFAVAAQDYGVAEIAGTETGGFSCQTGQVRSAVLPGSGLVVSVPLISYVRPSGKGCKAGVLADLPVSEDDARPERAITTLAAKIRRQMKR